MLILATKALRREVFFSTKFSVDVLMHEFHLLYLISMHKPERVFATGNQCNYSLKLILLSRSCKKKQMINEKY